MPKETEVKYQDKIYSSAESISAEVAAWKATGKNIVFTNGVFDLLHKGHIHYLQEAKALGDVLIVGLNSDESVSRLKGESRPINSLTSRAAVLASMEVVDAVVVFEEDTPLQLISAVLPAVLVKGGDYELHDIVGADTVIDHGGEVTVLSFIEGYSSTAIINKILKK